jgi:hypothetical protein
VDSFKSNQLYLWGRWPQHILDRRLGMPQSWSGCCWEEKHLLALPGSETQPSSSEPAAILTELLLLPTGRTKVPRSLNVKEKIFLVTGSVQLSEQEHKSLWLTQTRLIFRTSIMSWMISRLQGAPPTAPTFSVVKVTPSFLALTIRSTYTEGVAIMLVHLQRQEWSSCGFAQPLHVKTVNL